MRGRTHSREFKLDVVRQVVSGAKRPVQVCREYGLSDGVLHRWRTEYAGGATTPSPRAKPPAKKRSMRASRNESGIVGS